MGCRESDTTEVTSHALVCFTALGSFFCIEKQINYTYTYSPLFKLSSPLCSMCCGSLDERGVGGRMDLCIYTTESLHCSPETITTLLIGYVLSYFSCVQLLAALWTVASRSLCPCNSPGKNTGVGCHAILQVIFPTQGLNTCLLHLLYWQVGALPLVLPIQN